MLYWEINQGMNIEVFSYLDQELFISEYFNQLSKIIIFPFFLLPLQLRLIKSAVILVSKEVSDKTFLSIQHLNHSLEEDYSKKSLVCLFLSSSVVRSQKANHRIFAHLYNCTSLHLYICKI